LIHVHTSIRDIDEREWDELAGDNAFATWAWLLTIEECWGARAQPLYLTCSFGRTLTAATVCYVVESSTPFETLDDVVFGRLRALASALGASFLPALVCGPGVGYGWHVGVAPGTSADEARAAVVSIVEALEREAEMRRLSLHFLHVADDERTLRAVLDDRAYLRSWSVPVGVLDVRWQTFNEYLETFPGKTRNEMRREMRRNHETGTEIGLGRCGDVSHERLMELLVGNARKHRGLAFPFGPQFLDRVCRHMGDRAWLLVARKSGRPTAICVVLRQNRGACAFAVGVDSELASDDYTYFQIVFYSTIERAIAAGVERIYFGRGAYEAKTRRGCTLADTWLYSRVPGLSRAGVAAWYRLLSAWNRRKAPSSAQSAARPA
jgi:predicted N-acyltransferase